MEFLKIILIYKHKGSKNDIENYRPVSITCTFARLFERAILPFVLTHFDNIRSNNQHGFRKNSSTTTNLLDFYQKVYQAIDKYKCVDVIYFDLSKAFDKIDHTILMKKTNKLQISKNTN